MSRPAVEFARSHLEQVRDIAEVGVRSGSHALDVYRLLKPRMMYLVDVYKSVEKTGPDSRWTDKQNETWRVQAEAALASTRHLFILDYSRRASLVVPDGLDFVYIDASHDELSVVIDIACWFPKVRTGGIISGHDYGNSNPVQRAVDRMFGDKVQSEDVDWWVVKNDISYT